MTLRKSEAVMRMLVALALGIGFIGFATNSRAAHAEVPHACEQQVEAPSLQG